MKLTARGSNLGCAALGIALAACGGGTAPTTVTMSGNGNSASGTSGGGTGTLAGSGTAGNPASGSSGTVSQPQSGSSGQVSSGVSSGAVTSGTASGLPGGGSGTVAATGSSTGSSNSGTAGGGTGGTGASTGAGAGGTGASTGAVGASGASGTSSSGANPNYPPPPRPINVQPGGVFQGNYNGQPMYLNKTKPIQGKLVLFLGGICTGTGGGGFESFVQQYGFHTFSPKTDTCLDGAKVPAQYSRTSTTDMVANEQIGYSRWSLWDGQPHVSWYTVPAGSAIVDETVGAIKSAMAGADPGGDWGYFLDSTGNGLRTSDVWVVGYSWGSQTWAMISAYVPFGRVITTSGPQAEGFPNATWITSPGVNATPGDRKYLLVGFQSPYPSMATGDSEVMSMVSVVERAGWTGMVTNVMPDGMGTYTAAQHLFAMVGGNGGISPGGHTVFCNNNPANGWAPLCKHVVGDLP